jgi:hypothetical protein
MNTFIKKLLAVTALLIASGCATHPVAPYQSSQDVTTALQDMHITGGVAIDMIPVSEPFDNTCKGTAGRIELPNNMRYENYIHWALVNELKAAGIYNPQNPSVKLAVAVEEVAFLVFHGHSLSMWDIELRFKSSNGQSLYINHHHQFDAGAYSKNDCQKVAETFMPAVRATLFKLANTPEFKSLLTP